MASLSITQAELLDALAAAVPGAGPTNARTIKELSADTALTERRVRLALHTLNVAGRLQVHRITRTALDGRASVVPAYTILPAPKKRRS